MPHVKAEPVEHDVGPECGGWRVEAGQDQSPRELLSGLVYSKRLALDEGFGRVPGRRRVCEELRVSHASV